MIVPERVTGTSLPLGGQSFVGVVWMVAASLVIVLTGDGSPSRLLLVTPFLTIYAFVFLHRFVLLHELGGRC